MPESLKIWVSNSFAVLFRDALKGVGVWLAGKGILFSNTTQEAFVEVLCGLVIYLLTYLWSLFAKRNDQKTVPPATDAVQNFVRGGYHGLILIGMMSLVALSNSGCQSKVATAYTLRQSANIALQESLDLHAVGVINDNQLRVIRDAGRDADPILTELERSAVANNKFNWFIVLRQAQQRVDRVLRAAIEARLQKPKELSWTPPNYFSLHSMLRPSWQS